MVDPEIRIFVVQILVLWTISIFYLVIYLYDFFYLAPLENFVHTGYLTHTQIIGYTKYFGCSYDILLGYNPVFWLLHEIIFWLQLIFRYFALHIFLNTSCNLSNLLFYDTLNFNLLKSSDYILYFGVMTVPLPHLKLWQHPVFWFT